MCVRAKANSYSTYFPIAGQQGLREGQSCVASGLVLTCFGLATIRSNSSTFPTVWISFVVVGEAIALIGVRVPPTSRRASVATAPPEEAPIVRGVTTNACPQWGTSATAKAKSAAATELRLLR